MKNNYKKYELSYKISNKYIYISLIDNTGSTLIKSNINKSNSTYALYNKLITFIIQVGITNISFKKNIFCFFKKYIKER